MSSPCSVLRTGISSLVLGAVAVIPLHAQSADSVATDSTTSGAAPLMPGLSAPAHTFGSVRYAVDSSVIAAGARPRTLSELLQARLPGMSVLRYGGDPSDGSRARIRGTVSLIGDAAPIVVVDGIPVNAPERLGASGVLTPSSRFDDFDPEEIERVDVLPGPAATTMFGAGASNGAIVVTTKRGASGRARWNAWSQGAMTSEPATYPANYRQNGTDPVTGAAAASCSVLDIAANRCIPTTLDVWNPLESASPFRQGQYRAGGASVAGGPFGIRAFASASARAETSVLDDSEASRVNGRLNVERELFDGFVIGGNVGYVNREATLRADHVVLRGLWGRPTDDANRGYDPVLESVEPADRRGDRISRSARIEWGVRPWLRLHGLVGRDELTQAELRLFPSNYLGEQEVSAQHWQASSYLQGTAEVSHRVSRLIRLQSLLSYEDSERRFREEEMTRSTADGHVWGHSASWGRRSVRSWMLQERIDIGGEVFVNLGVRRIDGERSDGAGWHPSVDAAWEAGRIAGGPTLRMRGAYAVGAPPHGTVNPAFLGPVSPFQPPGPRIEPEQPREAEIGADVRWGPRLELKVTYFDQHTPKLIAYSPMLSLILASMENRGAEVGVRADVVDGPTARWTASMALAALRNRVGDLPVPPWVGGPGAHDGQPFGTVNTGRYTFVDADGDGLPTRSEISFSELSAAGTVIPTREASLRSELELRRWGVTLAAAFDHRGGHRAYDLVGRYTCRVGQCRGGQDPDAPIGDKVRAVAGTIRTDASLYFEDASFTRLGELALAWQIPARFGRVFGNGLTVVAEGRNLATWTKFRGPDPEVATSIATHGGGQQLPMLPAVPRTIGVRVEWR